MKAAQLTAPGQLEIQDIDVPQPTAGQVLLKVAAAGMCGSDVHIVHSAASGFPLPMTLGHETTGHVAELGSGATGLDLGEAVLVAGIWSCGVCRACGLGLDNACEYWATRTPVPPGPGLGYNGGMADYMVAPARALFRIGDLDPVQAAPLGDAGLTPSHAINLARPHLTPDATAVVIGVGGLGHMALQILRATTACRIVAVDTDPARLEAATLHGADLTVLSDADAAQNIRQLTRGLGAQAVFDFVGVNATLELARTTVARYGTLLLIGLGGGHLHIVADSSATSSTLPWGVSLVRPYGATRRDINEVIALATAGRIKPTIERHPLSAAVDVLDKLQRAEVEGRAVLIPDGS